MSPGQPRMPPMEVVDSPQLPAIICLCDLRQIVPQPQHNQLPIGLSDLPSQPSMTLMRTLGQENEAHGPLLGWR